MARASREIEARRQARTRDVNEWIEDVSVSMGLGPGSEILTFRCECGDRRCRYAIDLTCAEYEAVRRYATRFAIVLNHENPETDGVVAEYERYAVVEKLVGDASREARRGGRR